MGFLDDTGESVSSGMPTKLAATFFCNETTPLKRYGGGDVVALLLGPVHSDAAVRLWIRRKN